MIMLIEAPFISRYTPSSIEGALEMILDLINGQMNNMY